MLGHNILKNDYNHEIIHSVQLITKMSNNPKRGKILSTKGRLNWNDGWSTGTLINQRALHNQGFRDAPSTICPFEVEPI